MKNKEGITIQVSITDEIIDSIADRISEKKPDKEERTYTVVQVAEKLQKNPVTIRRHIEIGTLIAHKPGKNYIITEKNLKKYIHGSDL